MQTDWTTHRLAEGDPDFDRTTLLDREWLLTQRSGAYSMGTALGCNTRRYHGLLIAATKPPLGRVLALNQVFDQLVLTSKPTPTRHKTHADAEASSAAEASGTSEQPPTQSIELSSCLFPSDPHSGGGLVHAPQGHRSIAAFERGLTCRWTYRFGDLTITRELIPHDDQQAITLLWTVTGLGKLKGKASLHVAPMLTLRDYHGLTTRQDTADTAYALSLTKNRRTVTASRDALDVTFKCEAGGFAVPPDHASGGGGGDWWHNIAYPADTERGQGDREDYFVPGTFEIPLDPKAKTAQATLTAALGKRPAAPQLKATKRAASLRKTLEWLPGDAAQQKALALAADDFIVARHHGKHELSTILAGYPWFGDWGRDTFISLPGLLIATNRLREARNVLKAFASHIRGGLVPNRFDDYGHPPQYNTLDASLWFVHAALEYAKWDCVTLPPWLRDAVCGILDAYADGTEAQDHAGHAVPIGMDTDGLITAGHHGTQLTWMDAACAGTVFTPRPGKCVEINALWHHALTGVAEWLTDSHPARAQRYASIAARVKKNFEKTFWIPAKSEVGSAKVEVRNGASDSALPTSHSALRTSHFPLRTSQGYLLDHLTPDNHADTSIRPNQVFACSLERSPLSDTKQKQVLATVKHHLLTPVGLRTLPPGDPAYHPHYTGDQYHRDEAYHQGTIWPWLIGPYAEAILRVGKFSAKSRKEATGALQPLLDHLRGPGMGQLPELFDADPRHISGGGAGSGGGGGGDDLASSDVKPPHSRTTPPPHTTAHAPKGCPAQAWSVAEVLRVSEMIEAE